MAITRKIEVGITSNLLHSLRTSIIQYCPSLEQIPIKIGFFTNVLICSKIVTDFVTKKLDEFLMHNLAAIINKVCARV